MLVSTTWRNAVRPHADRLYKVVVRRAGVTPRLRAAFWEYLVLHRWGALNKGREDWRLMKKWIELLLGRRAGGGEGCTVFCMCRFWRVIAKYICLILTWGERANYPCYRRASFQVSCRFSSTNSEKKSFPPSPPFASCLRNIQTPTPSTPDDFLFVHHIRPDGRASVELGRTVASGHEFSLVQGDRCRRRADLRQAYLQEGVISCGRWKGSFPGRVIESQPPNAKRQKFVSFWALFRIKTLEDISWGRRRTCNQYS